MSQVLIILDSNTLSVVDWYFSDSPIVPVTPGITLPVPEGLTWDTVMAVRDPEGNVTLVEDPAKVAQKTANQWASVRAQQKQKLYESDWTCSVTDYEVPNKDQWITYRQALRDVTKQTDPFNIEWPTRPSA
jgi:Phage tail assembly chaperone protein